MDCGVECRLLALDSRADIFSQALKLRGIEVAFAAKQGSNPYYPARLIDILREIRRYEPDILHAHLGPSFHWCAIASLFQRQFALLTTEHASENRRMSMPILRGAERFLYGRCARIAVVSRDAGEALRAWLGIGAGKIEIIANGIELKRFISKQAAACDVIELLDGRVGIGMTARLVPAKDHETALKALSLLPDRYCLVLIGEGEERPSLEALARELGIAGRCHFLGSRQDVASVLKACSFYLQSSRKEGFGIAMLEAMAAGLPVVASDAPGLGALAQGAGLVFEVGDAAACAAALSKLAENPMLSQELKAAGQARAAEYSIERCAEGYARLYREIAKKRA